MSSRPAKEVVLKNFILQNSKFFISSGKSNIIFEKMIHEFSVITDCLIFSENKGIIGVEIKTENDSLKRLNKQMLAYRALCDFAWVLCHDKHTDKVLEILDKNNHINIGVISYMEYEDEILAGVIRDSNTSPHKDASVALSMLWKPELLNIANVVKNGYEYSQLGLDNYYHTEGGTIGSVVTAKMPKHAIVNYIVGTLGGIEASQLVCDMFIAETMHPDKVLKYYHFKEVDK